MNARNFCASPPVALASSAAEASGVWIEGAVAASTRLNSRTRRFSSRRSLRLYTATDVNTSAPVTISPVSSAATATQDGRHRQSEPDGLAGDAAPSAALRGCRLTRRVVAEASRARRHRTATHCKHLPEPILAA